MNTLPLFNSTTLPPLVLVLDDDEDDCFLLTHLVNELFSEQVSLVCTTNQADFLAQVASPEQALALIMLDYHLPLTTAEELICYIRAQADLQPVPVVVWSAQATPQQQQACLVNGASDYLAKQTGLGNLSAQLHQVFTRYILPLSGSSYR
ncbi:response regulator [Spirosoma linguale]|uniref:Response regulator receiver protein n=1 Tax=Spirosoma linguale (strain ATCC 33905 / DSM 74 / LMG 10896 / Claus 1) TaxID=504472 RepID=D2QCU8_SPILD|nr:response regulator receiver protein [Spirosoma linguale DSM 74]